MAKTDGQIDWPIGWEVDGKHVLQVAIQHEDALPRSKVPHSPTCIQTTTGERDKTQLDDAWLPVCNTSANTVSAHSNIVIKKAKKDSGVLCRCLPPRVKRCFNFWGVYHYRTTLWIPSDKHFVKFLIVHLFLCFACLFVLFVCFVCLFVCLFCFVCFVCLFCLFVCSFVLCVCLFVRLSVCLFSVPLYYTENGGGDLAATHHDPAREPSGWKETLYTSLLCPSCIIHTNQTITNKKSNSDAHVYWVWEWGSDLVEYLRLCLQIPQSPGVIKAAHNQQHMSQSPANLTQLQWIYSVYVLGVHSTPEQV